MPYLPPSATRPFRLVNLGDGPFKLDRSPGLLPQKIPHKLELVEVRMAKECAMATVLMSNPKLHHLSIRSCRVIHAGWKSLSTAISNHIGNAHAHNFITRLQFLHLECLHQRSTKDNTQAPRDWDVNHQASHTLSPEADIQTFFPYNHPILTVQCSTIPDNDPWMPCFKVLLRKPASFPG